MNLLAHLKPRSPWGGRQLSSAGCCLIIDLHILHVCVCAFVFGCISLIVNVCCINSTAMCFPGVQLLPITFTRDFFLFLLPTSPHTLFVARLLASLKSLFPSRRDGETVCRPALLISFVSRTTDQVTGYSRWCCVPEGICDGSMTYNLKMTCLWDDKALLYMKYTHQKSMFHLHCPAHKCVNISFFFLFHSRLWNI